MNASLAMNQYRQTHVQSGIESASPHRLVQMLMEGALEKIMSAKGFMLNNNIPKKGEQISWAISIIDGLRSCLDTEQGGEIAQNLLGLYNYMEERLIQANLKNNADYLDEVAGLLLDIKFAWDKIPQEMHNTSVGH